MNMATPEDLGRMLRNNKRMPNYDNGNPSVSNNYGINNIAPLIEAIGNTGGSLGLTDTNPMFKLFIPYIQNMLTSLTAKQAAASKPYSLGAEMDKKMSDAGGGFMKWGNGPTQTLNDLLSESGKMGSSNPASSSTALSPTTQIPSLNPPTSTGNAKPWNSTPEYDPYWGVKALFSGTNYLGEGLGNQIANALQDYQNIGQNGFMNALKTKSQERLPTLAAGSSGGGAGSLMEYLLKLLGQGNKLNAG